MLYLCFVKAQPNCSTHLLLGRAVCLGKGEKSNQVRFRHLPSLDNRRRRNRDKKNPNFFVCLFVCWCLRDRTTGPGRSFPLTQHKRPLNMGIRQSANPCVSLRLLASPCPPSARPGVGRFLAATADTQPTLTALLMDFRPSSAAGILLISTDMSMQIGAKCAKKNVCAMCTCSSWASILHATVGGWVLYLQPCSAVLTCGASTLMD